MEQFLKAQLAQKDNVDKSSTGAELYKQIPIDEYVIIQSQRVEYKWQSWGKCLKPCFTNMESPVVSQVETDCMTNCMAKALETMEHFHMLEIKTEQQE